MIENALEQLQKKAAGELVGPELLGDVFTLTNLKKLYEAIFQREIDAGNFRKKIISLGILHNTGKKDKTESKKGAFLYQLIRDKDVQAGLVSVSKRQIG